MNPFLEACGATGPLLARLELPGSPGGETRAFDQPFLLVGRDPRCDLRLDHPEVSERHAYLQLVGGRLVCIDLGSRTGVYQGGRCQRLIDVERDCPLRIGPYRIRLLGGDDPAGSGALDERPCPPLTLDLSHRALRQTRSGLPPGLALVGSGSDCQIRLIDPSVSAYHCSLVHTARGVWAIDLLGQSGLRVNGQEVSDARVFEGDVVQVGHSEIRLTAGDSGSGVLARGAASPAVRVADLAPPEPPSLPPVAEAVPVVAVVPPESRDEVEAESRAPDIAPPEERPWPPAATPAVAVAAAPAVPSAPAVAVVEQVLASVVSQVGEMQRQMLEDFQQARMALQETFASLHQEQTAFLDHELDQLQRISQELQGLRDQLRRQTDELAERLAAMPATAAPRPQPALLAAPSPSAPHSEGTLATPINGASPRNGNAPHVDSDVAWTSPRRESSHDENIHAQLCERIARIQSEHQSRWRKLLGLLPNKPGKPADR